LIVMAGLRLLVIFWKPFKHTLVALVGAISHWVSL